MTMPDTLDIAALRSVIRDAKEIAKRYRNLTGKPLGITGEVGEFTAAELMNLRLTGARQPGYDAVASDGHHIQIKARCILPNSKKSERLGSIRLKHQWDTVMLILMDGDFQPLEIYEAKRPDIERELTRPSSKARNVRGSLGVSKFKSIASSVWSKPTQLDVLRSKFRAR
jgi:hypothetical protein